MTECTDRFENGKASRFEVQENGKTIGYVISNKILGGYLATSLSGEVITISSDFEKAVGCVHIDKKRRMNLDKDDIYNTERRTKLITNGVESIIEDLTSRSGFDNLWDNIDDDTKVEIKGVLSVIIYNICLEY